MPTVEGDGLCLGTEKLESSTLFALFAKAILSYALTTVAVNDVEEIEPIHARGIPWHHVTIFSNIMIMGALCAPTCAHPLIIGIKFAKLRELVNHFNEKLFISCYKKYANMFNDKYCKS